MPILFTHNDIQMTRTQPPLIFAFAVAIHKVQGQTLHHSFVNLDNQEFSPGLANIALTRVMTLSSLSIHAISEERWLKIGSPSTRAQPVPSPLPPPDLRPRLLPPAA